MTTTVPTERADGLEHPALEAAGLHKWYPGVHAVRGVDLTLAPGQVHGLVGENGAGKSTLVKMVTGAAAPDSGVVRVFGTPLTAATPSAALRAGVAAVHQEPNVVPALSPVANVFLGQTVAAAGWRRDRVMRDRFRAWVELLDVDLPADGPAGRLTIGACQRIEIIRALEHGARVLVMDEPTASLSLQEREGLFRIVELLRARGTAIVYISHKLDDVLRLSEVVTVMRDGAKVATCASERTSTDMLVEAMLDRRAPGPVGRPARAETVVSAPPSALAVEDVSVPGVLDGVTFDVAAGEVVGIAGLVGAGRSTLLRAIAGAEPRARGTMRLAGRPTRWPRSAGAARRLGIALVPEDRRTDGLVPVRSAAENIVLGSRACRGRLGLASRRRIVRTAAAVARRVRLPEHRLGVPAGVLSGGNQQKVMLARAVLDRPTTLLVDEPTRGVDVGAKAEILGLLRELAGEGTAVVMVSEETDELLAAVDRVLVLREGAIVAEHLAGAVPLDRVLTEMFPASTRPDHEEAR